MKDNQAGVFMWQVWLVDKCVRDIQVCVGGRCLKGIHLHAVLGVPKVGRCVAVAGVWQVGKCKSLAGVWKVGRDAWQWQAGVCGRQADVCQWQG